MKEYKITYKENSHYNGMYGNEVTKITIIEAENGKRAIEKFYNEFKDVSGKGSTAYILLDIANL